jgi:iron complex transport system permease protein
MAVLEAPASGSARLVTAGRTRTATAVTVLVAAVVVASVGSVLVGSRTISPGAVLDGSDPGHAIAMARTARTCLALAVGAALGLAGALMQGLTRNPLSDPGILGINAGASFAMVLAISVFAVSSLSAFLWFAFAGAAVTMVAVHAIAALGRDGATPMKLVIAGAALAAGLSSWTSGVLLTDRQTMESFRYWQVGTVGGRGFDVLLTGAPFLLVGALIALLGARPLNALALGDHAARGLGLNVVRDRLLIGLACVLLAGGATALAGPIAFVGLVVPHVVRALVGPDHRRVLPLSLLGGAVLVVLADVVGRVVLPPTEVQVGIMCAVVGVPFFLVLVRRGRMS